MDEEYDRFVDHEPRSEGRGRSAAKRAAKAVEEVARQLVELPEAQFAKLPLEADLRRELELARGAKGHSAAKRQLKHLAGLLRRYEDERRELETWLAGYHADHYQEVRAFHDLEKLRERLCTPGFSEQALAEVRDRYPQLDLRKLEGLVRGVQATQDKKAYREIFRRLKQAEEEGQAPAG